MVEVEDILMETSRNTLNINLPCSNHLTMEVHLEDLPVRQVETQTSTLQESLGTCSLPRRSGFHRRPGLQGQRGDPPSGSGYGFLVGGVV